MALVRLPGGVIYDDVTGTRINEPQGINFEAIHRQLGAQATAAMDAAQAAEAKVKTITALPPGGLAGDFLTRTATGFRWMPPVMDLGDVIVDVSGLYFIDNGDGTSTPAHPELFVDHADGTSTLKGA